VLARNVAEYPGAANPHDSLGRGLHGARRPRPRIQHYERALALDPTNANAVARLKKLRAP
jgi:hypothetical protein